MPPRSRAIAFDVDAASLVSLREALPGWEVEEVTGATAASLGRQDWNPGSADLLVVKARAEITETLGLCRYLVGRGGYSSGSRAAAVAAELNGGGQDEAQRAGAPLLVLVTSGEDPLVTSALEAGAEGCLVLPFHAKDVVSLMTRARLGNQPGRHSTYLDRAQREDRWQDEGGQG